MEEKKKGKRGIGKSVQEGGEGKESLKSQPSVCVCVCVCMCPLKTHATSVRGWRSDDALSLISQRVARNRRDVALAWLKNCQYPPVIWSSSIREKRRKICRGERRRSEGRKRENVRFFFFFSKSSLRNYQIYHIFHWKKKISIQVS